MFTEPKIVNSDDLTKRAYITFYFNNERVREYNAKCIGLKINPNRSDTLKERNSLLRKLQFEIHKALEAGTYRSTPLKSEQSKPDPTDKELNQPTNVSVTATTLEVLTKALKIKASSSLSTKYKRNLEALHKQLTSFLNEDELKGPIDNISAIRLDMFLTRFNTSGTYYMNKRRDLSVLFNLASKIINKNVNTVKNTERRKAKASLHLAYEVSQLKPILNHLKQSNHSLYICSLLTYATWLRPHEEIRLLTKANFVKDDTEIHLSGEYNKGGKVRTVFIPDYVRLEVDSMLVNLNREDNIFTGSPIPLNPYYFSTQWKRASKEMIKQGLIYPKQTLYSFRHTAAIQLYKRTKDVHLLQKLLGHSTIVVTLKYLRSLGELSEEDMRDAAPHLDM